MSAGSILTAPLIWIVLPAVAGIIFWLLRRRFALVIFLSTILCLIFALLAWVLPIGQPVHLGAVSFTVDPTLDFAGRKLVLEGTDRSFLIFVYFLCAFWFAGSYAAGANTLLIPFGLGIVSLLVSAQAVEPFLYAALLIEMAVLLAVPVLAPPGKILGQGVLRFLIFQTLAMPFVLLAGWAMAGVDANPTNLTLVTLSTIFLGLGFAFWLAVFPFYSWMPLLAEQSYPYVTGFIFLLLPTTNLLLGLNFLNQFGWLRGLVGAFPMVGQIGALMVVTAGVWAAFQRDLARLFGYGVIIETGYSLLAISLASRAGDNLFASMFLPRLIGFALWALSLSVLLRETRSTRFEDVEGMAARMPFATAGIAVASLTLGGLPLLAVFPIHQVLLEQLSQQSFFTAMAALAGSVGMLFSAFRSLSVLTRGMGPRPQTEQADLPAVNPEAPVLQALPLPRSYCETPMQIVLIVTGVFSLILIGIFPQAFLPLLNGLLAAYPHLP